MDAFIDIIDIYWIRNTILYLLSAILLFAIGRVVFQAWHKNINFAQELTLKDNFAFAISVSGYYLGLLFAIGGTIQGTSFGIFTDLENILFFGLSAILLLNLSSYINDKLILTKFKIRKEIIRDENAGAGFVEAANYIACGLIVGGAVNGDVHNFFPDFVLGYQVSGILTMIAFWILGQAMLIIAARIYNKMISYDLHKEILHKNIAAGIAFGAFFIAMANLFGFGISDDFVGWEEQFSNVFFDVGLGLILLPLVRWMTDLILLPGGKFSAEIAGQEKPNVGAGLIEAVAYIGSSLLITWCL